MWCVGWRQLLHTWVVWIYNVFSVQWVLVASFPALIGKCGHPCLGMIACVLGNLLLLRIRRVGVMFLLYVLWVGGRCYVYVVLVFMC